MFHVGFKIFQDGRSNDRRHVTPCQIMPSRTWFSSFGGGNRPNEEVALESNCHTMSLHGPAPQSSLTAQPLLRPRASVGQEAGAGASSDTNASKVVVSPRGAAAKRSWFGGKFGHVHVPDPGKPVTCDVSSGDGVMASPVQQAWRRVTGPPAKVQATPNSLPVQRACVRVVEPSKKIQAQLPNKQPRRGARMRTLMELREVFNSKLQQSTSHEILLDLFSGTGRVGASSSQLNVPSLSLDILGGWDLTDKSIKNELVLRIQQGHVWLDSI